MSYLLALIFGALGAALGAGIGVGAGLLIASAANMSNFEGAAGTFAVFACGPIGAILGLGVGVSLAARRRGFAGFAAHLATTLVGLGAIAGAGFYLAYGMREYVNPNGLPPRLMFEIRLPAGAAPPPPREGAIELHTNKNRMPATVRPGDRREDGGRPVIEGYVEMAYNTTQRLLIVKTPDRGDIVFKIGLPGIPKHSKALSPWRPADHVFEPGKDQARPASAADGYEIRYRAAWVGED